MMSRIKYAACDSKTTTNIFQIKQTKNVNRGPQAVCALNKNRLFPLFDFDKFFKNRATTKSNDSTGVNESASTILFQISTSNAESVSNEKNLLMKSNFKLLKLQSF